MESCALILCLSFCLFLAIAYSICFFSRPVSFRFAMKYCVNLLVKLILPCKAVIEIVGHIRPLFRAQEQDIYHVPRRHFKRLTVALKHRQQEERQHHEYHDEGCGACADGFFEQKEKRYTDQRTAAEADTLPLREIEQEFCFDFG